MILQWWVGSVGNLISGFNHFQLRLNHHRRSVCSEHAALEKTNDSYLLNSIQLLECQSNLVWFQPAPKASMAPRRGRLRPKVSHARRARQRHTKCLAGQFHSWIQGIRRVSYHEGFQDRYVHDDCYGASSLPPFLGTSHPWYLAQHLDVALEIWPLSE